MFNWFADLLGIDYVLLRTCLATYSTAVQLIFLEFWRLISSKKNHPGLLLSLSGSRGLLVIYFTST